MHAYISILLVRTDMINVTSTTPSHICHGIDPNLFRKKQIIIIIRLKNTNIDNSIVLRDHDAFSNSCLYISNEVSIFFYFSEMNYQHSCLILYSIRIKTWIMTKDRHTWNNIPSFLDSQSIYGIWIVDPITWFEYMIQENLFLYKYFLLINDIFLDYTVIR